MNQGTKSFGIVALFALVSMFSCGGGTTPTTDGGTTDAGACNTISTSGPWNVFTAADGGPNTVVGSATGTVQSCTEGGKTRVKVDVSLKSPDGGASAARAYGAHVHVAACNAAQAGGHYRDNPDAGASMTNEFWLDFTTDSNGAASVDRTAAFLVRPGEAKAVVIHDHTTDTAGAAGAKLVCVDVAF